MIYIVFILLFIVLLLLIFLWYTGRESNSLSKVSYNLDSDDMQVQRGKNPFGESMESNRNPDTPKNVLEVFEYYGTKILHENGVYTVNHNGKVNVFTSWQQVPIQFQKMVKELDERSLAKKGKEDYFLEILNGFYYVTEPGGKKKSFRRYEDIPPEIRKKLGKR